jgi:hypothetical protein
VVVDRGTTTGRFGPPVVLARHANPDPGLSLAVSGSGVTYAAWNPLPPGAAPSPSGLPSGPWMIAVAPRNGDFSKPRNLLPAGGELLDLASGPAGQVLAVWEKVDRSRLHGSLDSALLGSNGQRGRTVQISKLQIDDSQPEIAVNDEGAIAAAWTRGETNGGAPGLPRVPDRLRFVLCTPAGQCTLRPSVEVFREDRWAPFVTVDLTDDGTVCLLIHTGNGGALTAIVSRGGRAFSHAQTIAPEAGFQTATVVGRNGVLTVFPGPVVDNELSGWLRWSLLAPNSTRFGKSHVIKNATGNFPPQLAANLAGRFVITFGAKRGDDRLAATGSDRGLSHHYLTVSKAWALVPGIDGTGNAIVVWNTISDHVQRGVFAAFQHA